MEKNPEQLLWPSVKKFVAETKGLLKKVSSPIRNSEYQTKDLLQSQILNTLSNKSAQNLWNSINKNCRVLVQHIDNTTKQLFETKSVFDRIDQVSLAELLDAWILDLAQLKVGLVDSNEIVDLKERLQNNWIGIPIGLVSQFDNLYGRIKSMPEGSKVENFLGKSNPSDVEKTLETVSTYYQEFTRNLEQLEQAKDEVYECETAYKEFVRKSDAELNSVYEKIKLDFRKYYHFMIREKFNVKEDDVKIALETREGELRFDVGFYDRGTFPPTAVHSEGYQDVIGICMFLAIINRERDGNVPIMLLDDILTSVDENHRDRVCKMLKKFFRDTQIIATTHDRVMARHFRNQGLVSKEVRLIGWDLMTGPKTYQVENWQEKIDSLLKRGETEIAAHQLRYHLEGILYNLACDYGAMVSLRRDNQYGFGKLKDAVVARVINLTDDAKARTNIELLGASNKSEYQAVLNEVKKFQKRFKQCVGRADSHQWLINMTLHNDESLIVSKDELKATAIAYKNLLNCLWCSKCNGWINLRSITKIHTSLQCLCKHK